MPAVALICQMEHWKDLSGQGTGHTACIVPLFRTYLWIHALVVHDTYSLDCHENTIVVIHCESVPWSTRLRKARMVCGWDEL